MRRRVAHCPNGEMPRLPGGSRSFNCLKSAARKLIAPQPDVYTPVTALLIPKDKGHLGYEVSNAVATDNYGVVWGKQTPGLAA